MNPVHCSTSASRVGNVDPRERIELRAHLAVAHAQYQESQLQAAGWAMDRAVLTDDDGDSVL